MFSFFFSGGITTNSCLTGPNNTYTRTHTHTYIYKVVGNGNENGDTSSNPGRD